MLILARRFRESLLDLNQEMDPLKIGVKGAYKVQVCRKGYVIDEPFGPWLRPNLLLNAGLDVLMSNALNNPGQYVQNARIGTGTNTPAITDTALQAQTQANNALFTGGGNTYANDTVNGAWTATWVFEFPAVGATVGLNECGLGFQTTTSLVTRTLFPSTVTLNNGDNMRLTYAFTFSIPALITQIPVSLAAVNGFNASGNLKVCGAFSNIFGTVNAGDTTTTISGPSNAVLSGLFGSNAGSPTLLSAPTAFPSVNTQVSETVIPTSTGACNLGAYTPGSFTRTITAVWTPSQPPTTANNVNMIRLNSQYGGVGLFLLLTSVQTKANTNTLSISFSTTTTRV